MIETLKSFFEKNKISLLFFFIFTIAVFFRFYKFNSIPFGLNNDAAWEGSAALNILHGDLKDYLPYAAEGWRGEGIIRFIVAILTFIFGNDPINIKLSSEIFGIGIFIPLFLLLKSLFDSRLSLVTTFFVAISGWHITMSKTGWRAISVPFFSSILFYFYFRGLKTKKYIDFIIAGVILSIGSLYTYDAGRIILVFFLFWVVFTAIFHRGFIKNFLRQFMVLLISFLLTSVPMVIYAIGNWQNFISRSEFLFVGHQIKESGNLMPLIENLIVAFSSFNIKANGNDFFINRPLIDDPVAFLVPIGLVVCVWSMIWGTKKINYFFMFSWFIFSMLPGIISTPNGNREIGTIAGVYFFAALGLLFIITLLEKTFNITKKLQFGLITIFFIFSAFITFSLYLGSNRLELPGFYPETVITTNFIKTIWKDYDIVLTDNFPRELLTYYLYKDGQKDAFDKNYLWLDNSNEFLNIKYDITKKGVAFFMFDESYNYDSAHQLLSLYPNAYIKHLYYKNDSIYRPASLVVIVPRNK